MPASTRTVPAVARRFSNAEVGLVALAAWLAFVNAVVFFLLFLNGFLLWVVGSRFEASDIARMLADLFQGFFVEAQALAPWVLGAFAVSMLGLVLGLARVRRGTWKKACDA